MRSTKMCVVVLYATFILFIRDTEPVKTVTQFGDYPYQASLVLVKDKHHHCSGAIMGGNIILSLATCVYDQFDRKYLPSMVHVLVGSRTQLHYREVVEIIVHKGYNQEDGSNNIALLLLDQDLPYDNDQEKLVPSNQQFADGNCTIIGWGFQYNTNAPFDDLTAETTKIIDQYTCQKLYQKNSLQLASDVICAISEETHLTECTSHLGRPLICEGIVTGLSNPQISGQDSRKLPCVYTSIRAHDPWIFEQMSQKVNITKRSEPINSKIEEDKISPAAASTFHMKVLSVVNFALIYYVNKFVLKY